DEILAPEFQRNLLYPVEELVPLQQSTPLNLWAPLEELLPFPAVPILSQQTSIASYVPREELQVEAPRPIVPQPSYADSTLFLPLEVLVPYEHPSNTQPLGS